MNKKETSELKKNFSDKSGFFIMERILTGFVDAEKNVRYHKVNPCVTMSVEEHDVYDETLKKYDGKYLFRTVLQIDDLSPDKLDAEIEESEDDSFVKVHYGDWPSLETEVVNTKI
jgi:hypothetical protein